MKEFLSFRGCIRPIRVFVVVVLTTVPVAVSYEDESIAPTLVLDDSLWNVSDYWIEDHPYMYQPHWKRLSNGKIVLNNDSISSSSAGYHDTAETQSPWLSQWVFSTKGQNTLRKDLSRLLMYNLVSPMDYGSSLRSNNVRQRRNKAARMFLMDNLALPLLKSLGRVAQNLIQSHYVDYFKDEMFAQRLKMMNASEMIREFNLTLPIDAIKEIEDDKPQPNTTQAYKHNGEKKRAQLYRQYSTAFAPYEGYSDQFYSRDNTFSSPSFPADSYPWLWSPRLNQTRMIALQVLKLVSVNNALLDSSSNDGSGNADLDPCLLSGSDKDKASRELTDLADEASYSTPNLSELMRIANEAANTSSHGGKDAISAQDIQALEEIRARLQEFYFDTGIPRLMIRPNVSRSIFPSLTVFLRASMESDAGANHSVMPNDSAEDSSSNGLHGVGILQSSSFENAIKGSGEFSSKSGVYAALTHYYAYPLADKHMIQDFETEDSMDCTVTQACLMYSGVTVYTPSLTTQKLFQTFTNMSVTSTTKRSMRLNALLEMVQVAFEAERRALKHGLQGPSTVWYSIHDLDVDEFADAVLGTVNMSVSGDPTPLHIFDKHMKEQVPILDEVVSYYADTIRDTKISMKLSRSISILDEFEESELIALVSSVQDQMQNLDQSIVAYVQSRAANPSYQELVNATTRGDLYNGSEYTLVGFGFIVPATNSHNVLYRDMKLPVPFHLALRLMVRFQESCLLLPQESRQLLVCLAMAFYNISFYRCHRHHSTP